MKGSILSVSYMSVVLAFNSALTMASVAIASNILCGNVVPE